MYRVCEKYEPIVETVKTTSKYGDSIKSVIPTGSGVEIRKILQDHKILDWNLPWLEG